VLGINAGFPAPSVAKRGILESGNRDPLARLTGRLNVSQQLNTPAAFHIANAFEHEQLGPEPGCPAPEMNSSYLVLRWL